MTTIRAINSAIPVGRLTNDELIDRFGAKEMASVAKMTGIITRRVAAEGQCASDLAVAAAERLIACHGIDRSSIDALIFTTQTPDYRSPATACALHGRLKLSERCAAFDINQACSGFIYALSVAHGLCSAGIARRLLLLNGDTLTKLLHPQDRGMVALTGDAAAATLIEASPQAGYGIENVRICTDGSQFDRLIVPAGGCRMPIGSVVAGDAGPPPECMRMDGPAVFHFSVYRVSDFIKATMAEWNLTMDDVDLVLLHQANKTMLDLIYKATKVPAEKQFINITELGNTAGASLPVLLSQAWREGRIRPGSRTLLCGFGAGLSWGMISLRWPEGLDPATPGDIEAPWPPPT